MADYGIELIEKKLKDQLLNELNRASLLFRLHSRIKDNASIIEKIERKAYDPQGKLMQDLIGFRVTTYFNDDISIVVSICQKLFIPIELVYDEPEPEVFRPLRKNMICRLPEDLKEILSDLKNTKSGYECIDSTFEIQFRTTLSEGWHEIDHNLRYKCKHDWTDLKEEGRMLNGIYAALETSDQTLRALFEDISYEHFKNKRWQALIRNKFRLRFFNHPLREEIISILDKDENLGKEIFKINRESVIRKYLNSNMIFPITFDSLIFFINYFFTKNEVLHDLTPEILLAEFRQCEKV